MKIAIIMVIVALLFGMVTAIVAGMSCLVYELIPGSIGENNA